MVTCSMSFEVENQFFESERVNTYHSKKNDRSNIVQLVNRARALQQGDKSVLIY